MREQTTDNLEELRKGKYGYAEDLYLACLNHNVSADYLLGLPKGLPFLNDKKQFVSEETEGTWRGIRKQIATNLKIVRRSMGLKHGQVAEHLGFHRAFYIEYEIGRSSLLLSVLRQLCLYFNISADYILGLPKGLPYPDDEE